MKPSAFFLSVLLLCLITAGGLRAQCILANPSFEVSGSGGAVFAGWDQFGTTGSVTLAFHGSAAARVSGQNTGSVNESGYWQQLDCEVGQQWRIAGHVFNPAAAPLTGDSGARVKVEWFGAGGGLIDLASYSVADASSPPDQYLAFALLSPPAPAGTASLRLVLTVLQGQNAPVPDLYYDQITCYSTTYPTIDP
ncbi:MAG: hypothetical protein R6T89_05445 [Candidatus Syntrophosphaera sp.]